MIDVKVLFENGDSFTTGFNGSFEEALSYYVGHTFNLGTVADDMQTCIGVFPAASDDIPSEDNFSEFRRITKQYGFRARQSLSVTSVTYGAINAPVYIVTAKDTDGRWCKWFSIVPDMGAAHNHQPLVIGDNTDVLNIWLGETRPDLAPDDYIAFFSELNQLFGFAGEDAIMLRDWIDPEDWQSIAGVHDANDDPRYSN